MRVIGRDGGDCPAEPEEPISEGGDSAQLPHVAALGRYRARDGSGGARVGLDVDGPHVVLVLGKRGYGKSHTVGVLAEELARSAGVSPILADPMGVFRSLAGGDHDVPATPIEPAVAAHSLAPGDWCAMLGLDPAHSVGSLVWRAAATCETLAEFMTFVTDADATASTRRAAVNHLRLAASWGVFDAGGRRPVVDSGACATVDGADLDAAAMNAVVAGLATRCYEGRLDGRIARLPWLLLDEAHAFFDGIAASPLRRLLTRGRQPGVSLVAATQRPSALPAVAISQADVLVIHRLTSRADQEALAAANPSYLTGSFADRMPTAVGEALVVDDATESIHTIQVRERDTPHDGASPKASDVAIDRFPASTAIERVE